MNLASVFDLRLMLRGLAVSLFVFGGCWVSSASAEETAPTAETTVDHWAFHPMVRPAVPAVKATDRVRSPIDAFVLSRLEARGLKFAPAADRATWLRRVTFDLTGLPPTPEEIAAFLADDSSLAFEAVVDRLLASPQYGEAWGRMWLDAVRFAETAGFNADPTRPLAYKYRDYVIRAFNRDVPYSQFIADQLAGDELSPGSPEALSATGYNRMWPDESNASDVLLARQTALNDLTGNVGAVFLGLSIGCAQCHDHKFDPLLQSDFYQLQAFFSGIVLQEQRPIASGNELARFETAQAEWLAASEPIRRELHALETAGRQILCEEKRLKFPAEVLAAIDTFPLERTPVQHQLAFWAERQVDNKDALLHTALDDFQRERREVLVQEWKAWQAKQPKPPTQVPVMAVAEVVGEAPKTFLLAAGSYEYPLEETPPGYPVVLRQGREQAPKILPPRPNTSGRRSELARWLANPEHPLTHRVAANRIWQGHFGRGIVENANDFGTQTAPPTHPELLDWLATELLRRNGSWKAMHKEIVLSETYRQAPLRQDLVDQLAAGIEADPDNELYWHFPRRRLSAERIRDGWLAASGQLNDAMFGPGVKPELPPNFAGGWKPSEKPADRVRRSTYIFAKRNLPYPLLQVFDLPDMHESCGCRTQTVIAPQALALLNSELVLNAAAKLAQRVRDEADSADPHAALTRLWQTTFGRDPSADELSRAHAFLASRQTEQPSEGGAAAVAETNAWTDLAHALLNANEFLYVE